MEKVDHILAEKLLNISAIILQPENPFTWASGWNSPIYTDNRKTLSYPDIRNFIKVELCRIILEKFKDVDVIAGVATGAIAQGALVADTLGLPYVYVRSNPKDHGLENLIEGNLKAGAFRFITTQGRFWPGFTKDAADGRAKFQAIQPAASEDDDDNRFTVEADGNYVVTLNTATGEVTVQAQGTSGYSQVWVLGSATENDWNWDTMPEMTQDAANSDVFTWTGALKEGQIKFPLDKSQGTFVGDCVVAKADNTPIGTELDFDIEYIPQNDATQYDRKWFVSADQAGTYTVRLDFGTKKISFTKQ